MTDWGCRDCGIMFAEYSEYLKHKVDVHLQLTGAVHSPAPIRPVIDFSCRVCGVQCDTAPDPPDRAVCPEHCEDHEYEYVRSERGHFCKHCNQPRPEDWGDE
jgi:hypothetical protein